MRYGVCVGIENPQQVEIAKAAGFDYVEGRFASLARADETVIDAFAAQLQKSGMLCEAANVLVPGELPLLGAQYDARALAEYLETGFSRGSRIGLKTAVLGSGAARRIPDGMTYREAFVSLSEVLGGVMAPIAEKYGATIVIEPLRSVECNFINTVKEGVMLAAAAGKENVSGLGDLFHMVCEGDTCADIRALKGDIRHAHLSYPLEQTADGRPGRCYPSSAEEYDYRGFIDALREAGCPRCSIEARTDDFAGDCARAGKLLRTL